MPIDYSKYPANWKTEIVPRILKRADYKCEFCGIENGYEVVSAKIYTRQQGRYSYRTVWFKNVDDYERVSHLFTSKKIVRVVLTIAHLDHDENNHNVTDDRLAALCQYCHLKYDAKEKYMRACNKEII